MSVPKTSTTEIPTKQNDSKLSGLISYLYPDDEQRRSEVRVMGDGPKYLGDFSLALINRTGAYYICRDIVNELPEYFAATRYWRMLGSNEPSWLVRKAFGKAMLAELGSLRTYSMGSRKRLGELPVLYFDPLYVLNSDLDARDIVLCHDVGPVTHTDLFPPDTTENYKEAYGLIKARKPGIVFVSEASKDAFVELYGDDFRFLEVIPLYVRTELTDGPAVPPADIKTPFFLTVGALEVRKNHQRIIEAFVKSGLREEGYSYVFCGPRGNSAKEVKVLGQETEGVINYGYLKDEELRWLYRNATAFVLPSLLEGFGVPPLEAALHGLVSVVSKHGAQREAVGDTGILVDEKSVDDIARGMLEAAAMSAEEKHERARRSEDYARSLSKQRFIESWRQLLSSA